MHNNIEQIEPDRNAAHQRRAVLGLLASLAAPSLALAQAAPATDKYPVELVRLVVPFAPGGPNDIVARLLATELSNQLNTKVIVDNKPGANTQIGTEQVARARPDGSSLLFTSLAIALLPLTNKDMPIDVTKDLVPVARVAEGPLILVVNSSLPVKTLAEFLAYAKANPGKLNHAPSSAADYLAGEIFRTTAAIDTVAVRHPGVAQAVQALLANQVHYLFATPGIAKPHLDSGALRALAVTTSRRFSAMPNLPTIAESGLPDFSFAAWQGLFAAAGTPRALLERLNHATVDALKAPAVKAGIERLGYEVTGSSADDFSRYFLADVNRWMRGAKQANVKLD